MIKLPYWEEEIHPFLTKVDDQKTPCKLDVGTLQQWLLKLKD